MQKIKSIKSARKKKMKAHISIHGVYKNYKRPYEAKKDAPKKKKPKKISLPT